MFKLSAETMLRNFPDGGSSKYRVRKFTVLSNEKNPLRNSTVWGHWDKEKYLGAYPLLTFLVHLGFNGVNVS